VGRLAHAAVALERAIALRPDDAEAHCRLGDVLVDLERVRDARRAFERALRIDPRRQEARLMLDALDGRSPTTLPPDLVAREFDRFAPDFERHLVGRLGYRGPALVWDAVRRVLAADRRRASRLAVLDVGCGTGLAAPLLAPHAARLVGVDLSSEMIERARGRRAYDRLITGELTAVMGSLRERFDVVCAADVFIYVGDLAPPLAAIRRVLKPGGWVGFSVEVAPEGDYRLQPTRRFTHSLPYVRRLAVATGLSVRAARRVTLRYERAEPVRGAVFVLRKRRE
jgi:predicted TPR repeat methyltransferase